MDDPTFPRPPVVTITPAASGWVVIYPESPHRNTQMPLAGWLTTTNYEWDHQSNAWTAATRTVACIVQGMVAMHLPSLGIDRAEVKYIGHV